MFKFKKSIVFIVLGSFLFALIAGGKFPYFIFYSILLAVFVSYIWAKMIISKIKIYQETALNYIYVGDETIINTIVSNRTILPVPYIEINNEMIKEITGKAPGSNIVSLMPLGKKTIPEKLMCRYRGVYSLGPVNIEVSDIFGMFKWNKKINCDGKLTIYPKLALLRRFDIKPAQTFGTVTTKQRINEDYSSISDIKKYYPGDSIKKIHWKVSARKGSLHIKNFDTSGSIEANLFLNLFEGDYKNIYRLDMEEKAVECAAALVYFMLSRNINTGLYTNCKNIVYTRGRDLKEFRKFMEEFVKVKSDGLIPMIELLKLRIKLLPHGSSIIIITSHIYQEMIDRIIQLKESGFDVIIVYIMVENLNVEYAKIISSCGIKLLKVGVNDDVRTSLEG